VARKRTIPIRTTKGSVKVRRTWPRNPTQKAHGTKKGLRGYDRRRAKQTFRKEIANS